MSYLVEDQITITDFSPEYVSEMYNKGFVFTRLGKGVMTKTRSLRIDLSKFEMNSENRRIMNKYPEVWKSFSKLPLEDYSWEIHQLGKKFYSEKFGDMTMSASKIKEMFTDIEKSNMNYAFKFSDRPDKKMLGYCLCYKNDEIIHYAYPFYDLDFPKDQSLGMAMMLQAVFLAKNDAYKYIYLGSVADERALYKLQFKGLEWFDSSTNSWNTDVEILKKLVRITASSNIE